MGDLLRHTAALEQKQVTAAAGRLLRNVEGVGSVAIGRASKLDRRRTAVGGVILG